MEEAAVICVSPHGLFLLVIRYAGGVLNTKESSTSADPVISYQKTPRPVLGLPLTDWLKGLKETQNKSIETTADASLKGARLIRPFCPVDKWNLINSSI